MTEDKVDVYPVGVLAAILSVWRILHAHHTDFDRWAEIRRIFRIEWHYLTRRARHGQWHEIRMSFNGYLAEPRNFPPHMRRCGSGWTRDRAIRSLRRHGYRGPVT